jgi:uncharacterized membrane protein
MFKNITLKKALPYIFIVCGLIGFVAAFILSLDKVKLLENPAFQPNCNLNPVISCGSVMKSDQGSAFGFPNPWIGLAAFAAVITIGISLLANAKFKRWFWLVVEGGIALGLVFAAWLLYESVYHINALCPYCLAVDVAILALFWYTTIYNMQTKAITVPKSWQKTVDFIRRHHLDILILIFIIITAVILKHFWYYYGSHL